MKLKKLLSVVLSLTLVSGVMAVSPVSMADEDNAVYVSTDGSDDNSGTFSSPLATLAAAKEKVKSLDGAPTVYFREGSYTFADTVIFDSSDKSDVTYRAYNDEKVVFTSGTAYSGFEECTVNGVAALKKNVGKDADFNVLFNSETTLSRTRYPESGYLYPSGVDESHCLNPELENDKDYYTCYDAMIVNPSDLPALKNPGQVIAKVLHWWKDETLPVVSYDSSTGLMVFSKGASMTIRTEDRYYLENVFEALNEPGEWYLDKTEGVLYYIPQEGETADNITLWGSDLETLIEADGITGITFENIVFRGNGYNVNEDRDFSQAAYDATPCVSFVDSSDILISNCEFRDIAGCSLYFGTAVTDSTVENCLFENIGAQAVYIRGENVQPDNPDITKNITVKNNIVDGYGRVYLNAVGILVIHANSVDVCNNEIHDGYYTAISCGWVWGYAYNVTSNCHICNNLIYNIGQGWLSDMGGIYMLGNQPGTVLSGNVIHNVAADPDEGGYGGWGIYLDEGSSYMLVEKNLSYACGSDAYHLHYGSYNTVRNNIFALSGESCVRVVSNTSRVTPADGGTVTADFTRNILLTDNDVLTYSYMQDKDYYTEHNNILWNLAEGDEVYVSDGSAGNGAMSFLRATEKGWLTDDQAVDPLFRDAADFDFALDENSPAYDMGFESWDYNEAGTITGTTVGLDTAGGTTAYNADSARVAETSSREIFHYFLTFFWKVIRFFRNLFAK